MTQNYHLFQNLQYPHECALRLSTSTVCLRISLLQRSSERFQGPQYARSDRMWYGNEDHFNNGNLYCYRSTSGTRDVLARTSSASQISAMASSCCCSWSIFGIKVFTMVDHACDSDPAAQITLMLPSQNIN